MAELSLAMPSLRARSPKFSCDAETIAKAIHLREAYFADVDALEKSGTVKLPE